jgi:CBS domain-containing protein
MHVQDVLKSKSGGVIVVRWDATVAEAVGLLVAHNIGSLPVLDASGTLVGIYSERDLLRGIHAQGPSYVRMTMLQVMTPDPYTCSPRDDVHDVMGMMTKYQVGQLPVVSSGGEVVGMVSGGDLVRYCYESVETENRHLLGYLYGPTTP